MRRSLLCTLALACQGPPLPPGLECPEEATCATGAEATPWWTLPADGFGVALLSTAWPAPFAATPGPADRTCTCTAPRGARAFAQESGTTVLLGSLDEAGRLDGALRVSRDGVPLLEARYAQGEPAGAWTFRAPQGEVVAEGAFSRGRPHGPWRVTTPDERVEDRYVYGKTHGTHRETFADGRLVLGRYFNGTRNYEWDFVEQVPGAAEPQVVRREAWKYDTFVVQWDPRTDPNPIPTLDLPGPPVGPQAEGMCKVHSRCASNAYLTAMLAGRALDPDGIFDMPILVDFAAPDATLPSRDHLVVVDSYLLGDAEVAADQRHARVPAEITTLCVVRGPQDPIEQRAGKETVTLELADEDGVWKLVRPPPEFYVRLDVYLERLAGSDPGWAERVRAACGGSTREAAVQ